MKNAALPLAALCLALAACGGGDGEPGAAFDPKTAPTDEVVLEAYRLIDKDRSADAVQILEEAVTARPQDLSLRSTLASAYAHQAGIKVQTLYPAAKKALEVAEAHREDRALKKHLDKDSVSDDRFAKLARLSRELSMVVEAILMLPRLDHRGLVLVREAVAQYEPVEASLGRSDFIYRALLRALLLRAELTTGIDASLSLNAKNQCVLDLDTFQAALVRASHDGVDAMLDLAAIDRSQAPAWAKRAQDAANAVDVLTVSSSTLIVLDEAIGGLAKKQFFGPALGDLLECKP